MIKFLLPSMFAVILLFPASAQVGPGGPAMQCTPSVSVTPTLRSEGFTERVGDLILFCTGGVPRSAGQAVPTARIEIYFNTGVTNRVYAGGWSDAMLIIDEPNSGLSGTSDTQLACADPAGACTILANGAGTGAYDGTAGRPNVFPGTAGSYGNSVKFSDIPMYAPGSGARILRFTNIRVNATSISAVTPTPVIASISSSGDLPLAINQPTPTVAFVAPTLVSTVRAPDDSAAGSGGSVNSCLSPQRAGVLRFSELIGSAFKVRSSAPFIDGDTQPAPAAQSVPSAIYSAVETGFYNPALTAPTVNFANVGLADSGTRLRASISNIPPGARVWVSLRNTVFTGGNPAPASAGTVARLVASEGGAFAAVSATTVMEGVPVAELSIANGGAAAVWEVLANNPTQVDDLDFVVWVQAGTAAGSATVNPSYAPAPATFTAGAGAAASDTLPIPRFIADTNPALPLFDSPACQVSTTTSLTVSSTNVPDGTPVTLTANVTAASGQANGIISFLDGGATLATSPVTGGNFTTVVSLPAGTHSLTAAYSNPNGAFMGSVSSPTVLTVQAPAGASTTTSLTASSSNVAAGTPVTLSANVTAGNGQVSGSVRFLEGGSTLATSPVTRGTSTAAVTLGAGTHSLTAAFSDPNGAFAASVSSPAVVTVQAPASTATALTVSPSNVQAGTPVTLTASVTAAGGAPSGMVSFLEGGSTLATSPVTNGTGAVVLTLSAGSHSLTAAFSNPNGAFGASISSPNMVTVQARTRAGAEISLTSSLLPSVIGQGVTFTAVVSGGSATPTGSVRFSDGNQTLGTVGLLGGQASIAATLATAGTHDIFAFYSGDAVTSDASTRFGQVVNRLSPAITLSSSAAAAVAAQSIVLSAQLSAPPAGALAATGKVQFLDGTSSLGTVAVSNGAASLSVTSLGAGAHQLSAVYSGDANWYSVRSQPASVSISRASTTTSLGATFTSAGTTLNATVSGPQSATISGSVQFFDSSANSALGVSQISAGAGGIQISPVDALKLAGHSISAIYSGTGTLAPSTSSAITLAAMVNAAGQISSTFAPEEFVSIFGARFSEAAEESTTARLPEALGGLTLSVADSGGSIRNAGFSYVSPGQVNFVLPAGTTNGPATFRLARAGIVMYTLEGAISRVAPGIFAVATARDGDAMYLVIYGTGIRNRSADSNITCLVNGQALPVLYAGAQPQFAGVDQVNVLLPAALNQGGQLRVSLMVDGQPSNVAAVTLQ